MVLGERRGDCVVLRWEGMGPVRGGLAQPGGQGGIGEHGADRVGEPPGVARRDQDRGVLAGQLGVSADARGHDGHPGPQRLLEDE